MSSGRWLIRTASGLAALGLAWPAATGAQGLTSADVAGAFDQDLYSNYQAHAWASMDDLVSGYEASVAFWMPIAPPGTNLAEWVQGGTRPLVLFDPSQFPTNFTGNLVPAPKEGVTVYPVFVLEDPATRDRVAYNAEGAAIATLPPPAGYDPLRFFRRLYPDFEQWSLLPSEVAAEELPFDPARLAVRYDLILDEDLVNLLLRRAAGDAVAKQASAMGPKALNAAPGGRMAMNGMQSSSLTNIVIDSATWGTGGIALSISFPNDMTSGIDVFSCTNLDAFQATAWLWAATNLSTVGGSPIQWTDTTATGGLSWFYAVGDEGLDSDGDGLSDAQEMYVYHTDPHNADTDGDGMPDGWEVRYGLNPLVNDANGDLDGDGVSNLDEYLQGRDPTKGAVADSNGLVALVVYTRLE